jgi:hypothetical protein
LGDRLGLVEGESEAQAGEVEFPREEHIPEDAVDDSRRVGVVDVLQESVEYPVPAQVGVEEAD